VTIPYKEKVFALLDGLDKSADAVGAVNTVKVSGSGSGVPKLVGYNTDVYGFRQSIKPFLASHHERALILGTGGASKAVEYVLREIGVECIFVSREKRNVAGKTILTYGELNSHVMAMCKLIVNCTPVGTFPHVDDAPEIPYEFVTAEHFLYDLVYNPEETEFIKRGKANGAMVMNGMDMLKMQAEEAWRIWNTK
jgi:shikimate dehydrogenase